MNDELTKFVCERIEDIISQITETRKSLGEHYDPNAYGTGYDEGELAAYKSIKAFLDGDL